MVSVTSRVFRRKYIDVPNRIGPNRVVKAGFPAGEAGSDIVSRAIWNEFGTRGGGWGGPIPERPFMRNSFRNHRSRYQAEMRKAAKAILEGKLTMDQVLQRLGAAAQGHIQQEITSLRTPPNSPVTIARKGSSNPLIDTGQMRQAVTYKLDRKR